MTYPESFIHRENLPLEGDSLRDLEVIKADISYLTSDEVQEAIKGNEPYDIRVKIKHTELSISSKDFIQFSIELRQLLNKYSI